MLYFCWGCWGCWGCRGNLTLITFWLFTTNFCKLTPKSCPMVASWLFWMKVNSGPILHGCWVQIDPPPQVYCRSVPYLSCCFMYWYLTYHLPNLHDVVFWNTAEYPWFTGVPRKVWNLGCVSTMDELKNKEWENHKITHAVGITHTLEGMMQSDSNMLNQSINQSINQSLKRLRINHTINEMIKQSINQL